MFFKKLFIGQLLVPFLLAASVAEETSSKLTDPEYLGLLISSVVEHRQHHLQTP